MINNLISKIDYRFDTQVHCELEQSVAERVLRYHCEKKALSFLIDKKVENPVIYVDLRMCGDCHKFFKQVSKYYSNVTISCIDPNKTHIFTNGSCSCASS